MKITKRIKNYKFGIALRRARVSMGITQKELGRRVGLSQNYVCSLEKGKRGIDLPLLADFCEHVPFYEEIEKMNLIPKGKYEWNNSCQ